MSLEDIRNRYKPKAGNTSEELKRLRAETAQQKRDIIELLGKIEQLETGKSPGPEVVPGAEDAAIDEQLESAGLKEYVPQGPPTASREARNVAANTEAGRVNPVFQTTKGIPIETHAFEEPYEGRR